MRLIHFVNKCEENACLQFSMTNFNCMCVPLCGDKCLVVYFMCGFGINRGVAIQDWCGNTLVLQCRPIHGNCSVDTDIAV